MRSSMLLSTPPGAETPEEDTSLVAIYFKAVLEITVQKCNPVLRLLRGADGKDIFISGPHF